MDQIFYKIFLPSNMTIKLFLRIEYYELRDPIMILKKIYLYCYNKEIW